MSLHVIGERELVKASFSMHRNKTESSFDQYLLIKNELNFTNRFLGHPRKGGDPVFCQREAKVLFLSLINEFLCRDSGKAKSS